MRSIFNYNIIEKIYESNKTLIYRATRTSDAQKVILKLLRPESATPVSHARFKQEYEIASRINREGVIKTYNLEEQENSLMMKMEDIGEEPQTYILRKQSLELEGFLLYYSVKISHYKRSLNGLTIQPGTRVVSKSTRENNVLFLVIGGND